MEAKYSIIKDERRWSASIEYSRIGGVFKGRKKYLEAEQSYIKAIEMYPQNLIPYMLLAELYTEKNELEKLKRTYELATVNNAEVGWGYAGLGHVYGLLGDQEMAAKYRSKARDLRNRKYNTLLRFSFLKVKDILDRRKIKLICMQYPMRDLESLRKVFLKEDEGVIFIDNENIFIDAISREGYGALFVDNFAGDFGHCTPRGNRLIAENAADSILNYLSVSSINR